jgi:hypothetical protein
MRVKPWATFTTALPDDQVEDGDSIVVYGGRNVAVAIGEIFSKLGCKAAEPYALEEQGWEFLLSYRGHNNFSCRVSSFHPAFRLLFEELSLRPKAFRNTAVYAELARSLDAALGEDPRFRDITWWTSEEGPPEPDEISSVRADTAQSENASRPIARTMYVRRHARGWWLVLAFWTLGVAAMALKDWLWAARLSGEQKHENLVLGLIALGIGSLALWAGFRRPANE